MEQKRLAFRFRIPWISGASVPRPAAGSSSRRPKKEPKSPFRPPVIAPIQPQQHSPSRPPQPPTTPSVTIESSVTSQTTQFPSRSTSKRPNEESKSTDADTTRPSSSTSQQEKQKMAMPMSKQSQQKKWPFKIIPPDPFSQSQKRSTQHTGKLGNKEKSATTLNAPIHTEKLETDTGNSKTHWEEQSKSHQSEEKGKAGHKPEVGKAQDPVTGRQQVTDHPLSRVFRADKKQEEAAETTERKMMFAASNPTGKDIKVVSSTDPMVRNVSSISPPKPLLPTGDKDKAPLQKEIREHISNCVHKLTTGHPTQPMDDNPVSVTTLAGDNRGATMHIGSKSGKKERSIHIHRAYRKNQEQRPEVTTDGEESSEEESDNSIKNEVGNAYVNSNIQSLNNSLMCQSSINDRDPGVQLILPQKHIESIKSDDKRGLENRKAESNVTWNDGLSYRHRVRRRCLRGLFAEPSESDPDNPNKPKRHGCKYKCPDI